MSILLSIIHQGLIFSLVAIAVHITSRVINKDDLSVEGSFGFGGAVTAVLLVAGISPVLALLMATLVGALVGCATGVLYTKLKMNHLMAGLVSTTACFSISLALASANVVVAYEDTIFALWGKISEPWAETWVLITFVPLVLGALIWFLRSELGLVLRSCGDNPELLLHFGKSKSAYQTMGFAIANSLTAIAGSLFVQWSGFFSITGNIGTLVTGLASLMMAELIQKRLSWFVLLASMIYQSIFAAILWLGIPPVWNNLCKAAIIILLVALARSQRSHVSH